MAKDNKVHHIRFSGGVTKNADKSVTVSNPQKLVDLTDVDTSGISAASADNHVLVFDNGTQTLKVSNSTGTNELVTGSQTFKVVDSAHNVVGHGLLVSGGNTTAGTTDNIAGGHLTLAGGRGKGSAAGGSIIFKVADGGSSGAAGHPLNNLATAMTIADDKNIEMEGDLTVKGGDISGPADGSLTIKADTDIIFQVDSDNDHSETFQFKNGSGSEVLSINESGWVNSGNLISSGSVTAGNGYVQIEAVGGPPGNAYFTTTNSAHDEAGDDTYLQAGHPISGTTNNIAGGDLILEAGPGKGSGAGGHIKFKVANASGSGSSLNALATALEIEDDRTAKFYNDITIHADNDTNASLKLSADDSDDAGDDWVITSKTDNVLHFGNDIASAGVAASQMSITHNATVTNSVVASMGSLKAASSLFLAKQASALADVTNYGQVWVKNTSPNELWYTEPGGTDIQITSGTSVAGSAPIQTASITINESDMNALNTTEQVIVAAQGANQVIIPTSGMLFIDRDGSTAQSASVDLVIGWDGADTYNQDAIYYIRRFMSGESGDRCFHLQHYNGECAQSKTAGDNQPLTVKMTGAITSGSIDSMKVVVSYHVFDNS